MSIQLLVVEDDESMARMIKAQLTEAGYGVQVVHNGKTALEVVRQQIPDVVLLDVMMPDMDGIETCRRMRQVEGMEITPIIFLTGMAQTVDKRRGFEAGADDYVTKPFDGVELTLRIEAHLRRSAAVSNGATTKGTDLPTPLPSVESPTHAQAARVLIMSAHALERQGLRMLLDAAPSVHVVGEAEDAREAVQQAGLQQPEVILMDLKMTPANAIEAIQEVKQSVPKAQVIVIATLEDEAWIERALKAGVSGYLLTEDTGKETLLRTIDQVLQGGVVLHPRAARRLASGSTVRDLTAREIDVLRLLAKGLSNKAIAQELGIGEGTVKTHVSRILTKLDLASRTQAAIWAMQRGLTSPDRNPESSP